MFGRKDHSLADQLAATSTFRSSPRRDLAELAAQGRELTLPAGWTFLQEGTPADACYVLLEGSAHVRAGGKQVATIAAGAVVGEMGLVDKRLRNASVTADGPVRALRVEYDVLERLVAERPALRRALEAGRDTHRPTSSDPAGGASGTS